MPSPSPEHSVPLLACRDFSGSAKSSRVHSGANDGRTADPIQGTS